MSYDREPRDLSATEMKAVNLIRVYEKAIEDRRNVILLQVTKSALRTISEGANSHMFRVLKVETIGNDSFNVTFAINEFEYYLHFILAKLAMALLPDYTLILQDGMEMQL